MIPSQLQEPGFRFVLVRPREKRAFEMGWPTEKNYAYDDENLRSHLNGGGNYGVTTLNGLCIVDIDDESQVRNLEPVMPPTFTVRTAKGKHFYYKVLGAARKVILEKDGKHIGELQGGATFYVVGPNSTHPSGCKYVVDDERPIHELGFDELLTCLEDFLPRKEPPEPSASSYPKIDATSPNINDVARELGLNLKNGLNPCPFHKDTAPSLSFDEKKGVFNCFGCGKKGGVPSLVMAALGCEPKEAGVWLYKHFGEQRSTENTNDTFKKAARRFTLHSQADAFLETQPLFYDEDETGRGVFWLWDFNEYRWRMTGESTIAAKIRDALDLGDDSIKKKKIIIESLRQAGISHKPQPLDWHWIQFHDTLVNFETGERKKATPEYRCENPIPWRIGKNKETPTLDKLVKSWVEPPYDKTLFELLAYATLRKLPINVLVWLYGAGGNGKGRFLKILTKFIGAFNVGVTELLQLEQNRFEFMSLFRKLVVTIGETDADTIKKSSRIKQLTGEDLVRFEIKNGAHFSEESYALPVISTNLVPACDDDSDGWMRRQLVIKFPHTFKDGRDVVLNIPDVEFENLAARSIDILAELMATGQLTGQGTTMERRRAWNDVSNPLPFYLSECTKLDLNSTVLYDQLFNEYNLWRRKRGEKAVSKKRFSADIERANLEHNWIKERLDDGVYASRHMVFGLVITVKMGENVTTGNPGMNLLEFGHEKPYSGHSGDTEENLFRKIGSGGSCDFAGIPGNPGIEPITPEFKDIDKVGVCSSCCIPGRWLVKVDGLGREYCERCVHD